MPESTSFPSRDRYGNLVPGWKRERATTRAGSAACSPITIAANAIIAALSVQKIFSGRRVTTRRSTPQAVTASRNAPFEATPPAIATSPRALTGVSNELPRSVESVDELRNDCTLKRETERRELLGLTSCRCSFEPRSARRANRARLQP